MDVDGLTAGMRRWVEMLEAGYTVRPVIRGSSYRGTDWRGGLFNPSGGFVQVLRRDTVAKLMELGVIGPGPDKEKTDGDCTGADASDGGN